MLSEKKMEKTYAYQIHEQKKSDMVCRHMPVPVTARSKV
jgi:hypothetical protein